MELTALGIPDSKIKQLNSAGLACVEDLLTFFPRKYIDRSRITGLHPDWPESVFIFRPERIWSRRERTPLIVVSGRDNASGIFVQVEWYNQIYLLPKLEQQIGKEILVAGQVNPLSHTFGYRVTAPAIYEESAEAALGIYPVYKKVRGMSEEYLRKCIYLAAELLGPPAEILPYEVLHQNHLIGYADMISAFHWPDSLKSVQAAKQRQLWNDLFYFAMRIELSYRSNALGSPFNLPTIRIANAVKKRLPFELTTDQEKVLNENLAWIRSGKRANALIQGDVGCGKTIVAMLLMIAFAENGCQAALMAPTQILAQQHYDKLVKLVKPYNFDVAFVSGQTMCKAERQALEERISSGEALLIVGTQALLSGNYQFRNLALVIEDEEHKYGVLQRKALVEKASLGTHTMTMSATPIPRTLAQTIFGENVQLYSIHTRPKGRIPIETRVVKSTTEVIEHIRRQVCRDGSQVYVVCPLISKSKKVEGVATAEDTFHFYNRELARYGVSVALVTGKTKKTEAQAILSNFHDNKISVLVSTSVIEVGVDTPNATCIIVHNAERFGLAQLHQLRGRVGRGQKASLCILMTPESDNPRINAMCECSDGFKIAEKDLQLRGAGDLLGSQQSGIEKYLALALANNQEYQVAQSIAREMILNGSSCELLEKAMSDQKENLGGEMLA